MMLIKRPLERLYDYDSSVSVQVYILSVESFAICLENNNAKLESELYSFAIEATVCRRKHGE